MRSGFSTLGMPTIVFTDIEESVRAAAALGYSTYRGRMVNPLYDRAKVTIEAHRGSFLRVTGDSYLITFDNAESALRCVTALQKQLAEDPIRCIDAEGATWTIRLRIGVHSAEFEVSFDDLGELVGNDVNFAARVLSLGRGGQIIVSDATRRAAGGRENFDWKQWPDRRIKSFDEPETVWELLWDGQSRGEPGSRWLPDQSLRTMPPEAIIPTPLMQTVDKHAKRSVFMSYRRNGEGALLARSLRGELTHRGCSVFLDVDSLPTGHFDVALLREIENADNFMVILSLGCLDRCNDDRDWFRKEIAHAISTKRNIIPIMINGFSWPDPSKLPEDIRDASRYHGLIYSHDYFDAMMGKIERFLK